MSAKTSSKFPRQSKLLGKMRQYDITYEQLGKAIGRSPASIEAIVNGRVDFKLSLAKKIRTFLAKKSNQNILLDDIID